MVEFAKEGECIRSGYLTEPNLPKLAWYLEVCLNTTKPDNKDYMVIGLNLLVKEDLDKQKKVKTFLNWP